MIPLSMLTHFHGVHYSIDCPMLYSMVRKFEYQRWLQQTHLEDITPTGLKLRQQLVHAFLANAWQEHLKDAVVGRDTLVYTD